LLETANGGFFVGIGTYRTFQFGDLALQGSHVQT
jgi:hypothetical protein